MEFGNKLAVFVSALSIVTIVGSFYYYNEIHSKPVTTQVSVKKEKKEEKLSEKNVKLTTSIKDNKYLVVVLENISKKDLYDVVVEINFKGTKLGEIYIDNFVKDGKKEIEIDFTKKSNTTSIKDNDTLKVFYRLLEKFDFSIGEDKGEVLVSSLKDIKKEDYEKLVNESNLEQNKKEDILAKLKSLTDRNAIEKLLEENKVFIEIKLSEDTVKFGNEDRVVIDNKDESSNTPKEETSTKQQTEQQIIQENTPQPVEPVQPVQPIQPVQPTQPVVPQPVQPETPQPVQPTIPEIPANSGE